MTTSTAVWRWESSPELPRPDCPGRQRLDACSQALLCVEDKGQDVHATMSSFEKLGDRAIITLPESVMTSSWPTWRDCFSDQWKHIPKSVSPLTTTVRGMCGWDCWVGCRTLVSCVEWELQGSRPLCEWMETWKQPDSRYRNRYLFERLGQSTQVKGVAAVTGELRMLALIMDGFAIISRRHAIATRAKGRCCTTTWLF